MNDYAEGPNGETCTDRIFPWPRLPFRPTSGQFIPLLFDDGGSRNTTCLGNDITMVLARMSIKERIPAIEDLLRVGAENRGLSVSEEKLAEVAEGVATYLDNDRLKKFLQAKWPPKTKISLNLKYDFNKPTAGISISFTIP